MQIHQYFMIKIKQITHNYACFIVFYATLDKKRFLTTLKNANVNFHQNYFFVENERSIDLK